ncbi:MAG TPA: hypothetical protein VHT05_01205 [Candidatus Elarobacter sp.]|nr:hypothetical protein [Candidatus Elarobacter sp.]
MTTPEFEALLMRLETASQVLRERGCLLQAIARRYYVVYTIANQAATRYGVRFRRGAQDDDDRQVTHSSIPDIVRALYTGQNSGPVFGGGPGIARSGRLSDADAFRYVQYLQQDRKHADYGHGTTPEPYAVEKADRHLDWANHLIEDLKTLL